MQNQDLISLAILLKKTMDRTGSFRQYITSGQVLGLRRKNGFIRGFNISELFVKLLFR